MRGREERRKTMKNDNKLNIKWKMQTKYLHKIFELFSCSESRRRRRSRSQSIWKILERRQKVSTAIHEVARRVEKVVQPGEEEECGQWRWGRREDEEEELPPTHKTSSSSEQKERERKKKLRTFWYLHLLPTIRVDGGATAVAAGFANWQPGCIFTSARVATCPRGGQQWSGDVEQTQVVCPESFYLHFISVCVCVCLSVCECVSACPLARFVNFPLIFHGILVVCR